MKRKRRYPEAMDHWEHPPVEVPAEEFMTQEDAAAELGISILTVGLYVAEGRVKPGTLRGEPGVIRASVQEELARRRVPGYRLKALFRSLFRYI